MTKRKCKCLYPPCRHCKTSHDRAGRCHVPNCPCEVFI